MLRSGSMDFVGQKRSFNLQWIVIYAAGVIGFIYGYIEKRFLYTFYCIFGATMAVSLLCVPSWPIWNRHPVEWVEPREEAEEEVQKAPSKKKGKGSKKKD
uniref:Signal peptidase complex subunit 1 n=1 Tax=Zooxanthella nutricula TaxID=1333877 RepID=A0A7S2M5L0_9DINO